MFIRHRQPVSIFFTLCHVPQALHRFHGGRDLHFLTFSCYRRQPFFNNAAYRDLFLHSLERIRRRYRLVVLGYVVMPEHVHLLVSEPQRETLSTAIQALKLSFVRSLELSIDQSGGVAVPRSRKSGETWGTPLSFNDLQNKKKQNRVPHFSPLLREVGMGNHFWQARFYDFNVWTEKKRIEKLRYIHRNPVKRGLVQSPEQWRWSSFRWYRSGEASPVRINDTDILVMKVRPPTSPALF